MPDAKTIVCFFLQHVRALQLRHLLLGQAGAKLRLGDQDAADLRLAPIPPNVAAFGDLVDMIACRRGLRNLALSMVMKNMLRRRSVGGISRSARTQAVCAMPSIRHDRIFREGSELRLVHRQVLDADAMIVAAHPDDTVDQQKRIAVRQQPEDFLQYRRHQQFRRSSFMPFGLDGYGARHSSSVMQPRLVITPSFQE